MPISFYARFFLILLALASTAANAQPVSLVTRCQEGYPVKFDYGNKERPGIGIEIIKALEHADPEVHISGLETSASTPRIMSELATGKIDVLFAIAKNPEREAAGVFIEPPLYLTYQRLAVRINDDAKIRDFDDIRKLGKEGVLLATYGTAQAAYLQKQGGLIIDDGSGSNEQNLQKLSAGRGRFFYGSDIGIQEDIRRGGLEGKIKLLPPKFQPEQVYVLFAKHVPKATRDRIQADLLRLKKSGALGRIFSKYRPM